MGFPDVSGFSVVFATRARFKNKDVIVYTDPMHHSEVLERPQVLLRILSFRIRDLLVKEPLVVPLERTL